MNPDEIYRDPLIAAGLYSCNNCLAFDVHEYNEGRPLARRGAYTKGLEQLDDHPELILLDTPRDAARFILFSLGRCVVHKGMSFDARADLWPVEPDPWHLSWLPPQVRLVEFTEEEERRLFPGGPDGTGWREGPSSPKLRVILETYEGTSLCTRCQKPGMTNGAP